MKKDSSLGPDGFGPGFYSSTWSTTASSVYALFNDFHARRADLERINRSYLVLLPEKDAAKSSADYHPICLQNCQVKAIAKVLSRRLQSHIPSLVGGPNWFCQEQKHRGKLRVCDRRTMCLPWSKMPFDSLEVGLPQGFRLSKLGQPNQNSSSVWLFLALVWLDVWYS